MLQSFTAALHFADIMFDVVLISKRLGQHRQRNRIHVVRRSDAAHHRHLRRISGENPDAKTCQSISLRECSRHEEIRRPCRVVKDGLSVKLKVGFVHQNRGMGRGVSDSAAVHRMGRPFLSDC